MRTLRVTLIVIGTVQIVCGTIYVYCPSLTMTLLGVSAGAPAWVNYALATAGARFIGYGIGMFVAARAPRRHITWIDTMIAIQTVDLVATIGYVANNLLPLRHTLPTALLPALYIAVLGWARLTVLTPAEASTSRRDRPFSVGRERRRLPRSSGPPQSRPAHETKTRESTRQGFRRRGSRH